MARALEDWLNGSVVAAYDASKEDPSRLRSSDQVRATLNAEHQRARKTSRR